MNKLIMRFNKIVFLSLMISLMTSQARADWASDFLDQMKNNANLKGSSSIETQGSYGYSGGGFSYTYQNQTLQPFNVKAPSMSAGCGGISFDFGAFEFLNEESLIAFLEQLLQAAPGYAFELGMQILCPSCIDIMNTMNQIANTLNGLQFDACGTMEALSGLASDAFNQYTQSEAGAGYRNYKQITEDYVNKPLQMFDKMLNSAFDCVTGKGCPKPFFEGDKSLMQSIVEDMDSTTRSSFGNFFNHQNISQEKLTGIFRALFGDVAFTKRKDAATDDTTGNTEAHLVTYPGRFVDTTQVANYLAFGTVSNTIHNPGNKEFMDFTIATFTPGSENKSGLFQENGGVDNIVTMNYVAKENLQGITDNFINRTPLNDNQLLWLTLFKSPVYKAFNMYSISDEALKGFSKNFATIAGVQMVYEFLSQANKEILAGISKFQQGIEMAGYWNVASDMPKEIQYIKDRLRAMVETSYSIYVDGYDLFSKNMQDNNELVKLQNIQKAMAARHPVLGQKMFTPGF